MNEQSVLVVNGQPETEEVLKAVLEPRGFRIDHVSRLSINKEVTSPRKPQLIVLHEESPAQPQTVSNASYQDVPRVIIGSMFSSQNEADQGAKHLSQPFQYSELIRLIDSLLEK